MGNTQPTHPAPTQDLAYGARQETPYMSQPRVFYPTQPAVPDWSQPPPMAHQVPYAPQAVTSFNPVDTPVVPSAVPPQVPPPNQFFTSGPSLPPPVQYPTGGNGSVATDQYAREWANPSYGVSRTFQPTPGPSQPTTNMMFPGQPSHEVSAAPTPRGFMPVSAPRAPLAQLQPGMLTPPMQPQSPRSSSSPTAPAVAPMPAAPVTIQTVDTSEVPDDLKLVIATLSRLYSETTEALGGARANPLKKREIDDNSRKLGGLFARLNKADISPNARGKLIQICQSLDAGDYASAMQLQMSLTTSDWDECGSWLGPLKRMIKTRQALG